VNNRLQVGRETTNERLRIGVKPQAAWLDRYFRAGIPEFPNCRIRVHLS
jgi:hypothetical protein